MTASARGAATSRGRHHYEGGIGVVVGGTSLGPVPVSGAVQMWGRHAGASGITDILNDAFGVDLKRSAVQSALVAAGGKLQAERDDIAKSLGGASANLKADETTYGFPHGDGCAWTATGGLRGRARLAVARRRGGGDGPHRAVPRQAPGV